MSRPSNRFRLTSRCNIAASLRGRLSVCGVSTRGEEDFKSTRLAKFHRNSNTLVLAEGQDEEFVVSRIGFAGQCVSLPTARPLYMASELSAEQLRDVFASPDKISRYPNLLAGDGLVATLARDPSVYLKFARDWAASLLDDLAELIRF